jgi:hypothetical protein
MMKKNLQLLLLAGSMVLSTAVQAVTVTPGGELAGNANNCMTLSPTCSHYGNYQQVFSASSLGGLSGTVNSIAFRLDEEAFTQSFTNFSANYEVHLSHTNATPATLSSNLASNRGADDTIVLSGTRTYSATQLAGLGPNPFDFVLDLDDIFYYNGTGSLLLEILQISADPRQLVFDARAETDYTSRAFAGGSPGLGYGFVAQFDIVPRAAVPEPSTLALFGLGLIGLGLRRRRSV